jgi:hypothetical protein
MTESSPEKDAETANEETKATTGGYGGPGPEAEQAGEADDTAKDKNDDGKD